MKKRLFVYSTEDENMDSIQDEAEQQKTSEPTPDGDELIDDPDESTEEESTPVEDESGMAGNSPDDPSMGMDEDDSNNDVKPIDKSLTAGPLNVDLVYKKKQLETNNDQNSEQYENITKLIDKREDPDNTSGEPIMLDAEVNRELDKDKKEDGPDLLDDETVSNADDLNDEQYVKMEYENMAMEDYIDNMNLERNIAKGAINGATSLGKGALASARLAGRGISGGAKLAGHGAVGGAKLAGKGAALAYKHGAPIVHSGFTHALNLSKKSALSLIRFRNKHRDNYTKLEKKLAVIRKEVYLRDEIKKEGYYTNLKVIKHIVNSDTNDLFKLLSSQLSFYKDFSNTVENAVINQSALLGNLISSANNQQLERLSLKNFAFNEYLLKYMKKSNLETSESSLVQSYQSKNELFANKVILSMLPKEGIDTIEEYIQSINESKSVIYTLNTNIDLKVKYLNKNELLKLIDLAIILTREINDEKKIFNKISGFKLKISDLISKFNIIEKTKYYSSTDRETRKHINEYVTGSVKYTDRVYVDIFVNINNVYFNSLKYLLLYINAHLK